MEARAAEHVDNGVMRGLCGEYGTGEWTYTVLLAANPAELMETISALHVVASLALFNGSLTRRTWLGVVLNPLLELSVRLCIFAFPLVESVARAQVIGFLAFTTKSVVASGAGHFAGLGIFDNDTCITVGLRAPLGVRGPRCDQVSELPYIILQ